MSDLPTTVLEGVGVLFGWSQGRAPPACTFSPRTSPLKVISVLRLRLRWAAAAIRLEYLLRWRPASASQTRQGLRYAVAKKQAHEGAHHLNFQRFCFPLMLMQQKRSPEEQHLTGQYCTQPKDLQVTSGVHHTWILYMPNTPREPPKPLICRQT